MVRRTKDNEPVGVALNFDVYDEPAQLEASQAIAYVFELLGKLFKIFSPFEIVKNTHGIKFSPLFHRTNRIPST